MLDMMHPSMIAGVLATTMLGSWAIAWWFGRRVPADTEDKSAARFIDSSLALLGLLLGFTFAMALGKFEQRRMMVIADANSIGDFYTCASLLPEPHRTPLQDVTRTYAGLRLQWAKKTLDPEEVLRQSQALQGRMTELSAAAVQAGVPVAIPLVNTLNNLTSCHSSLVASLRDRLPTEVVVLLGLAAVITTILVGRNHGRYNKIQLTGTICYVLLVSAAVLVVLDLNQPRVGFITVETEPLERLMSSMEK